MLAKRGHRVHIISYALPLRLQNEFFENVVYHEVEMTRYPLFEFPLYTISLAGKMVEVATYERLDILHCHYAIPHATSGFLAKQIINQAKLKLVTTLHGTDITLVGFEPDFLPIMKFSIEYSDGVTAVSGYLREKTLSNYGIQKDIEVIHNFVDTKKYDCVDCEDTKKHYAPHGEKILIHTSNFREVKRVPDVIKIFAEVRKKIESKLILVGDGPERSISEHLVRELKLQDDVHFLGKQIDFVNVLAAADLFLMPSQSESFGLSALEAMSCHVPVIATSVGGLPELLIHGKTGYVAQLGDIERMAKYALDLLQNPEKLELFRKAARNRALDFDSEKIVEQYEQHYVRVLD